MEEASSAPSESWDLHSLFSAAQRRWNGAGSLSSATSSPKKQRIIFFDFDRTLTVIHVFKSLAGWVDSQVCMLTAMGIMVPRPHALTERGQLRRLAELGPAWTEQAFGGSHRITVLGELLEGLTSKGFSVMLITRGYIGVARHCLADAGLLGHFERVYGNVGAAYGERTDYDLEAAERHALDPALEDFLGRWDDGQWDSKNQLISSYMQTRKLGFKDIIFVDDDIDEIKVLKHAVSTVHVTGNGGMSAVDVQKILEMLEQETETWAQSCVQRWSAVRDPLASKPFAIVMFNRRHLPIRDTRHITLLEADFSACTNALRRVKMLLREPLLLWSVTQQAFVHHMATTVDRPFSLKALQPAIRGMHAHLLMEDESVARSLSANPNLSSMARSGSATFDSTFGFGEFQRQASTDTVDGSPEAPSTDTVDESPAVGAVGAGASGHLNLYSQPLTKSEPKQALRTLGSMVQMFQQALLGLCPITLNTAGLRRNVVACHEVRDVSSAVALWARYEKLEMVGCGHFGEVFRAREVCNGREVAVKVLERLEHNAEEEEHGEVSVLRALAHPNLLRIFEVVKSKDEIHIITELASGGTLSGHARKHESTRGFWIPGCMQQITSALAYCHRLYVLHGDLKPENVLVCGQRPDGTPLCIVCDFGHTTVCIGSAQVAAPGDPRYIAPEVVAEQGLSPKSDIYMLGVTAFELLTGGWIPFFNEKSCTLRMSYYQLKEAKGPCKNAYDAMLRSDASSGWGLWVPQHPRFVQRLEHRSKRSWTFRMLLALIGSGLDPPRVHGARLLFRRLDEAGDGHLTPGIFRAAAEAAGLSAELAQALFEAGDLHNQQFLDFENLVVLCIDLETFTREELLSELRSVLSRIRGPVLTATPGVQEGTTTAAPSMTISTLHSLLCQKPDARMERWVADMKLLLGPGDHELTAELLLRFLEDDGF